MRRAYFPSKNRPGIALFLLLWISNQAFGVLIPKPPAAGSKLETGEMDLAQWRAANGASTWDLGGKLLDESHAFNFQTAYRISWQLTNYIWITGINLRGNQLGPEGAAAFAQAFEQLSILSKIDLSENNLGPMGLYALSKPLTKFPHQLKVLLLGRNNIGLQGVTSLQKILTNQKNLLTLCISNNDLGPSGTGQLVEPLKTLHSLQQLMLIDDFYEKPENRSLVQQLCLFKDQKIGDLAANPTSQLLALALADLVRNLPQLTQLDLSGHLLIDEDMEELSKSLLKCHYLKFLSLRGCLLRAKGIYFLSTSFSAMPQLQNLYLNNNSLKLDGALNLIPQLRLLPNLQVLILIDNEWPMELQNNIRSTLIQQGHLFKELIL
jgi:Ran GTPase-activating protein (RanGAP) involved in mRNA processing and transport